jgi:hypothetical protein
MVHPLSSTVSFLSLCLLTVLVPLLWVLLLLLTSSLRSVINEMIKMIKVKFMWGWWPRLECFCIALWVGLLIVLRIIRSEWIITHSFYQIIFCVTHYFYLYILTALYRFYRLLMRLSKNKLNMRIRGKRWGWIIYERNLWMLLIIIYIIRIVTRFKKILQCGCRQVHLNFISFYHLLFRWSLWFRLSFFTLNNNLLSFLLMTSLEILFIFI